MKFKARPAILTHLFLELFILLQHPLQCLLSLPPVLLQLSRYLRRNRVAMILYLLPLFVQYLLNLDAFKLGIAQGSLQFVMGVLEIVQVLQKLNQRLLVQRLVSQRGLRQIAELTGIIYCETAIQSILATCEALKDTILALLDVFTAHLDFSDRLISLRVQISDIVIHLSQLFFHSLEVFFDHLLQFLLLISELNEIRLRYRCLYFFEAFFHLCILKLHQLFECYNLFVLLLDKIRHFLNHFINTYSFSFGLIVLRRPLLLPIFQIFSNRI